MRENYVLHGEDAHIDDELFKLFLTSGIYKEYADRFLDPSQIDEVDISEFVEVADTGKD